MARLFKYKTKKELEDKIKEYFDICVENEDTPEKAGLCLYLGICRDTYSRYRKDDKLTDAIKSADLKIESHWVRSLTKNNATGAIFYLKNAFKEHYKDRRETDLTSKGEKITITFDNAFKAS